MPLSKEWQSGRENFDKKRILQFKMGYAIMPVGENEVMSKRTQSETPRGRYPLGVSLC